MSPGNRPRLLRNGTRAAIMIKTPATRISAPATMRTFPRLSISETSCRLPVASCQRRRNRADNWQPATGNRQLRTPSTLQLVVDAGRDTEDDHEERRQETDHD